MHQPQDHPVHSQLPDHHPLLQTPAIWHPTAPRAEYAVVLFHRSVALPTSIAAASLWITASQRYIAWLDGQLLSRGPSRSDPMRWNCREVRLPPLPAGPHTLALLVWHAGQHAPKAQLGGPAFLLVAADPPAQTFTTAQPLRCHWDRTRMPLPERAGPTRGHIAVGAGELGRIDPEIQPWKTTGFNDQSWPQAPVICPLTANPWGNTPLRHRLQVDPLPEMQGQPVTWTRILPADAATPPCAHPPSEFDHQPSPPISIPPGQSRRYILDAGHIVNAYPELLWHQGAGANLRMVWSEAPICPANRTKTDRDQPLARLLPGMIDHLTLCQGPARWQPLWFRSFRYLDLQATAADNAPLILHIPELVETGFPLPPLTPIHISRSHSVSGPQPTTWQRLLELSHRTATLCSHETFFDCPHYEQSQFPGDARIQARYHYLFAADDRLPRKALADLHAGAFHSGLLRSHYPSSMDQLISTYSLAWIGMLADFHQHTGDTAWVRPFLPAARAILDWFLDHRRTDGLIGPLPAPFTDWATQFHAGNAPQQPDGGSAIAACMVVQAARELAHLEEHAGSTARASLWTATAEQRTHTILRCCWEPARGLLRDTPNADHFSVHAQTQAAIANVLPPHQAATALQTALADPDVIQPQTLYYRFWLAQALDHAGLRQAAAEQIDPWLQLAGQPGLTAWPETTNPNPRSDCHGWSVGVSLLILNQWLGIARRLGPDHRPCWTIRPPLQALDEVQIHLPGPTGPLSLHARRHGPDLLLTFSAADPVLLQHDGRMLPPGHHTLQLPHQPEGPGSAPPPTGH